MDGQARLQYELTLNPPPTRFNPTLPTQDSIERGAALVATGLGCDWQGRSGLSQLVESLDRTRDEALYNAVATGWRGLLPACEQPDGAVCYRPVSPHGQMSSAGTS